MTTSPLAPSTTPGIVKMRSPGEIVSAAPILLGFNPVDSLVIIALRQRRIGLTCRVDLDDLWEEEVPALITGALTRDGATSVILIGYADDRPAVQAALARLRGPVREKGITVQEELSVVDGRWFHETCGRSRCCPPEGTAVADHDEAPTTMALTAAKGGPLPSRDDLVALVSPDRPLLSAAIRAELSRMESADLTVAQQCADIAAVLGWGDGDGATPAQQARAMLTTYPSSTRDYWYCLVAPGLLIDGEPPEDELLRSLRAAGSAAGDLSPEGYLLDDDARERILARLREWVRNLPDTEALLTMAPLVVAAVAHWAAGDGALARVLLDRAGRLETEPMPMLHTLNQSLTHGLRPPHLGWLAPQITEHRRGQAVA